MGTSGVSINRGGLKKNMPALWHKIQVAVSWEPLEPFLPVCIFVGCRSHISVDWRGNQFLGVLPLYHIIFAVKGGLSPIQYGTRWKCLYFGTLRSGGSCWYEWCLIFISSSFSDTAVPLLISLPFSHFAYCLTQMAMTVSYNKLCPSNLFRFAFLFFLFSLCC